jgi:hypothetical protein
LSVAFNFSLGAEAHHASPFLRKIAMFSQLLIFTALTGGDANYRQIIRSASTFFPVGEKLVATSNP